MNKYSELLKHPLWQKKRLEIMDRDNWMCRLCGDVKTTLHVHHNIYLKNKKPWEYKGVNLITLCEKCHSNYHTQKNIIKQSVTFSIIKTIPQKTKNNQRRKINSFSIKENLKNIKNV